jgi:hypothetical protein
MKIGAENKTKLGALVVLALVAAYVIYSNIFATQGPSPAPVPPKNTATDLAIPDSGPAPVVARTDQPPARPGLKTKSKSKEFHPAIHPKNPVDQVDVRTVDPTLRLDLLAKVQEIPAAGGERDLFQILKAPPVKEVAKLQGPEPKVFVAYGPNPPPPPPPPPPDPSTLPPPPIPLKYYGFCLEHGSSRKTAFFLDNDEIVQAIEGSTLKGRYKVVQIRVNDVLMEDTQNRRQQSLKLEIQEVLAE